jgi:hypothetical protein
MMTCKDGRGPTQENKGAKEICASTTRKASTQISAERESERAQQKTQARRVSKMEERQLDKKKGIIRTDPLCSFGKLATAFISALALGPAAEA